MTVYIDSVFALNFLIDYLLLLTTARLAGMPLQRKRLLLCAGLGAAYAVVVFLPGCARMGSIPMRLLMGMLMALLAFWPLKNSWRLVILFFLISSALGGFLLAADLALGEDRVALRTIYTAKVSWPLLLSTTFGLDLLFRLLFRQGVRHWEGELMRIQISVHGKEQQLLALHDTGNTLRDPIAGRPVLVAETACLHDCFDVETSTILRQERTAEETIAALHRIGRGLGFTLLPFRSVGTSSGLLLAVCSDYINVGQATYPRAWIALTNTPVSDGGAYHALWGGVKRGEHYAAAVTEAVSLDQQTPQAG